MSFEIGKNIKQAAYYRGIVKERIDNRELPRWPSEDMKVVPELVEQFCEMFDRSLAEFRSVYSLDFGKAFSQTANAVLKGQKPSLKRNEINEIVREISCGAMIGGSLFTLMAELMKDIHEVNITLPEGAPVGISLKMQMLGASFPAQYKEIRNQYDTITPEFAAVVRLVFLVPLERHIGELDAFAGKIFDIHDKQARNVEDPSLGTLAGAIEQFPEKVLAVSMGETLLELQRLKNFKKGK